MHQAKKERTGRISLGRFHRAGMELHHLEGNRKLWSSCVSKKKKERDSDKHIAGPASPGIQDSSHPGLNLPFTLDTIYLSNFIPLPRYGH